MTDIAEQLFQRMYGTKRKLIAFGQSHAYDKCYKDPNFPSLFKDFSSPISEFHQFALYNHHGNFTYGEFNIRIAGNPFRRTQVATPPTLVEFMNRSVEYLITELLPQTTKQLEQQGVKDYEHPLGHPNVNLFDPFAGTGVFLDMVMRCHMTLDQFKNKWNSGKIQCFELDPVTALVCATNFELTYATLTGEYSRCRFVACIDTFQQDPETGSYHCQQDDRHYTENEMWHAFHV